MKCQKIIALMTAVLMLGILFAGCGGGQKVAEGTTTKSETAPPAATTQAQPAEKLMCNYVVPGSEPQDGPAVDQAITEKLQKDGVNLEFKRIYVPWDVWQQKTNVMMSTNEEFELIHIMEDWISSAIYVGKGGLAPLDEHLDKYGAKLKEIIPADVWDITRVNGKIYSIPVLFRDFAPMLKMSVQKQLFDKYNLPVPATPEELLDSTEKILKAEKNSDLRLWEKLNPSFPDSLHRVYDSYPFIVRDGLFMIDQQGNVKPWIETEEFKKDCEFYNKAYTRGIIHPDILTMPHENIEQKFDLGMSVINMSTALFSLEKIKKEKPEVVLYDYDFVPEKGTFRGEWVIMNANGVSSTSKHPEAGVMFYNWVYSSQENYDLLNYGIKDKHWKDAGERRFEAIAGADGKKPDYEFGDWEMGHYQLVRLSVNAPKELEPIMLGFDPKAVNSVAAGFRFNSEPVSAEYAAVTAEFESSIYPLKYGVISYEKGYERALKAMKTAGYDKVVAEFQKQFKEWYDARK